MVVGKTTSVFLSDPESTFFIAKCVGLLCLCYFTINICGLILSRCLMFVGERHLNSQEITFALLAHYVWPSLHGLRLWQSPLAILDAAIAFSR